MKRITVLLMLAAMLIAPAFGQKNRASDEASRSKTFKVAKGGRLDISTAVGDIRISPKNKDAVVVTAVGIDEEDMDRLKMEQSGNNVRVSFRPRSSWGGYGGDVRFTIDVPSTYDLLMKTSGGDITVENGLTGTVEGSTAGGDIKLGALSGDVDMSTSGGDISAADFTGNGQLRTSGGDIKIGKVGGKLEVATSGGDITVDYVAKTLEARTAGGDIEVGDVGGEAKVSTSGGDVRVGKVSGKANLSTAGGNIGLKGASGTVVARTAGGDVRLENVTGSVEAKTSGGEVEAEINPSGKGGSRLTSSGGIIRLALPDNAKATVVAVIRVHGSWGRRADRYVVRSEFPETTYNKDEDNEEIRAVYQINGGGERIDLETVNSDIEIRKGRLR